MIETAMTKEIATRNVNPESARFYYGAPKSDVIDNAKKK